MITLPIPGNTRAEYKPYDLSDPDRLLLEAVLSVTVPPARLDLLDRTLAVTIVRLSDLDGDRYGLHTWHVDALYPGPGTRSEQAVHPIPAEVVDLLAASTTPEAVLATVGGAS